jgi:hypothetical protein
VFLRNIREAFVQDRVILDNKVYRPSPNLVEGDGLIGRFRQWAKQFYGVAP